jgi:hypothetical protein
MVFVSICSAHESEITQLLNVIISQAVAESLTLFSNKVGNSHCDTTCQLKREVSSSDKVCFL